MNYKPIKNLLSKGSSNSKTVKNELETYILYLAPATLVDGFNLCPFSSEGCRVSCLYSAGRGRFNNVQSARVNRSKYWAYDREMFYFQLAHEISSIHDKAMKYNKKIAIRLNGTSDIDHIDLMKRYTGIDFLDSFYDDLLFYDYTKNPNHIKKYLNSKYRITFSRSECNEEKALEILSLGGNVAAVFSGELPSTWHGKEVINGDLTDLRYFDKVNVVVGLKAKGKAKYDKTGFVI